jgi:hypothetical protein
VTILRAVRAAATASLLLLIAACARADGGGRPQEAGGGGSYASDALVLRVDYTGGFVTPTMLATRLPVVSVYADGSVISEGPQILSYPPPARPNVQIQRIDVADVEALVNRARAAGIGGPEIDYGRPPIADAANTRFTLVTEDGTQVVEVYALAEGDGAGQGLTGEQTRARAALRDLLAALTDLAATLGAEAVGEAETYAPTALAAVATPWSADPTMPDQDAVAWPGPALPGKNIAPDTGCVTATGEDAARALAAAEPATAITPWTSGGKRWTVGLRPLLPDESGCADLI